PLSAGEAFTASSIGLGPFLTPAKPAPDIGPLRLLPATLLEQGGDIGSGYAEVAGRACADRPVLRAFRFRRPWPPGWASHRRAPPRGEGGAAGGRQAGGGGARSGAPPMQPGRPETTGVPGPRAAPTAPASAPPTRAPPVTTAICTPISRPRSASGTLSWRIVLRNTAEMTSAQPATASRTSAAGSQRRRPKHVIAAPHTRTAMMTARPCRRTRWTHPGVPAPSRPRAPGGA